MADKMLDHDDPLHHFMFEESRALAAREAAQRRAHAVPRPPQSRSLTVKQAWEAREASLLQTISLLEDISSGAAGDGAHRRHYCIANTCSSAFHKHGQV